MTGWEGALYLKTVVESTRVGGLLLRMVKDLKS